MYYKTPIAQFEFSAEELDELCYAAREAQIRFKRLRSRLRSGDTDVGHWTEESLAEEIAKYKKMEEGLRDRFYEAFGTDYDAEDYKCWDDVVAEEGATYVLATETCMVDTDAHSKGDCGKYVWKNSILDLVVYYADLFGPDPIWNVTYELVAPDALAATLEANDLYDVLTIAEVT